MAFGYYSPVTVNAAQVPSAQTNFPMLVSYTDARLKTVGNGGHVQNANGYDIRPYDGIGGSAMTFELERYNASTGEVIMWVLVPSCDVGSIVYLYYGDATISTNGSSTSTWDSNFKAVYHFPNGTTLSSNDSTTNTNNGTVSGSVTAITGVVDGGALFGGVSGDAISVNDSSSLDITTAWTISLWVKAANLVQTSKYILSKLNNLGTDNAYSVIWEYSNNNIQFYSLNTTGTYGYPSTNSDIPLTDIEWHYICYTYNGSQWNSYKDGAVITPVNGSVNLVATIGKLYLSSFNGAGNNANLSLDEVRISNIARSADWIITEYNNQSSPSTFATLGAEVSLLNQTNFFRMFN